ncbi:unnamed protein product, partial [Oikopleura dioica]
MRTAVPSSEMGFADLDRSCLLFRFFSLRKQRETETEGCISAIQKDGT